MVNQIEAEIRQIYQDILLQSNFKYIQYLKKAPKKLCRNINKLDIAYSYYSIQAGVMKSNEIENIISEIKSFVC